MGANEFREVFDTLNAYLQRLQSLLRRGQYHQCHSLNNGKRFRQRSGSNELRDELRWNYGDSAFNSTPFIPPWADLIRPSSVSATLHLESLDRRVKLADGELKDGCGAVKF